MNFAVHQHRKLSEILPVPDGLRELMADITREVLRFQPENIEAFIADYLESMLLTRELYQISSQTVEDVVDSSFQIVNILKISGISEEKATRSVEIIKEEFRHHLVDIDEFEPLRELEVINRLIKECKLTVDEAQKASEVVESAWCHFYQQNKVQVMKITPDFAHSDAVKNTLNFYQKSPKVKDCELKKSSKVLDIAFQSFFKRKFHAEVAQGFICEGNSGANWQSSNFHKRDKAANHIQSWFRARKFRDKFKEKKKAATVIQANYRGYKARKQVKILKFQNSEVQTSLKSEKQKEIRANFNQSEEKLNKAASKIQSWYRSDNYRIQRKRRQNAATIIQAHIRGFLTRKTRKEMNY